MKKTQIAVFAVATLVASLGLLGCASNKQSETTATTTKSSRSVTRETLDWKGSGLGAEIPDWAIATAEERFDELPSDMQKRLEGKYYITIVTERVRKDAESTKDLKMAQEVAAANYMVNIARSINSAVDVRFNGVLSANEDSQKTLVATASNARFSGFTRMADSWVLVRIKDNDKGTMNDIYTVVQIYACDEKLFQEQAANYIREIAGKVPDSADMQKAAEMADEIAASIKPSGIKD